MSSNQHDSNETVELLGFIEQLLEELSTEIDLHYEDEDFDKIKPTLDIVKLSAGKLAAHKCPVPEATEHVIERFGLTSV